MKQVREDQVGAWAHLAIGTCAAGRIPYRAYRKHCSKHRFVSKLFSLSRVSISVQKYLDSKLLLLVLSLAKLTQTFKRKKVLLEGKILFWTALLLSCCHPLETSGQRKVRKASTTLPSASYPPLEYHENSFSPGISLLQLRWLCQLLVESHFYRFWLSWMFCVFNRKAGIF